MSQIHKVCGLARTVTNEPHVTLVDRATKLPVRRLELRAQDGRMLMAEDTVIVAPSPEE